VKVFSVALDLSPSTAKRKHRGLAMWPAAAALLLLAASGVVGYLVWTGGEPSLPPPGATPSVEAAGVSAAGPSEQAATLAPSSPDPATLPAVPQADQGIPILVVLPFQDLTAEQSDQMTIDLDKLGKGIAEEFGTDLATFPVSK
jgi:hypothetical protein